MDLANSNKYIYASLIGAIGATLIPNPTDLIYWHIHKQIRDKWAKGEITSKQYWQAQAGAQYLTNAAYWISILGIAYLIPSKYKSKVGILLGIVAIGSIFTVLYKHYKIDENDQIAELNLIKQKLYESADDKDIKKAITT